MNRYLPNVLGFIYYLDIRNLKNDRIEISGDEVFAMAMCPYDNMYKTQPIQAHNKYINKPNASYRVGCVGFDPAIASRNVFYSNDAYQNMYDVNYKHKFRKNNWLRT